MIKSILVAFDESKSSIAALDLASELAKASQANLKGLHIEDISRLLEWQPTELIGSAIGASTVLPHAKPTQEQLEIEKEFEEEKAHLKEIFEDMCSKNEISHEFKIIRGVIEESLIKAAKTVDAVVIGKRGKSYKEESKEPGQIAEDLLRHITRPVFVVPYKWQPKSRITGSILAKKILLAYDGSENAQRALSTCAQFATLLKAEVLVISIANDEELAKKALEEAKEFLTPYKLKTSYKTGIGAAMPWTTILEEAEKYDPGLIVIGAFGNNKMLELLFGSTTKQILTEAQCPVLLCR